MIEFPSVSASNLIVPTILPLQKEHFAELILFANRVIGKNYFRPEDCDEIWKKSQTRDKMSSFVLVKQGQIKGMRLTYVPGSWRGDYSPGQISSDEWKYPVHQTACFKSLFIAPEIQGKGWGTKMSSLSVAILKQIDTKAIFTHGWKEAPGNSSANYLRKMGFQTIKEHADFWSNVDYTCPRCGRPCRCTAVEMIKYLEHQP